MIGRFLVGLLLERGAKVRVASLDASYPDSRVEFMRGDLTRFDQCVSACSGMEAVFHLAGIKGSPLMTKERPASIFVPTLLFNTSMMEAARQQGVRHYLYTSTIGVYGPAQVFHEDDVWRTFPSEHDRFAGWAKRMGELQAEAYRIEYGWTGVSIVRPANVYGPFDNFDPRNAMVIPSLIRRAMDGEDPLVVWGDGSPVRDFIHARDVARGMLLVMERNPGKPVNLGSGSGVSVRRLVELIVERLPRKPEVVWDDSKPAGDRVRLMDVSRAKALGFEPETGIEQGIAEVMDWYSQNRGEVAGRYNVFTAGQPVAGGRSPGRE